MNRNSKRTSNQPRPAAWGWGLAGLLLAGLLTWGVAVYQSSEPEPELRGDSAQPADSGHPSDSVRPTDQQKGFTEAELESYGKWVNPQPKQMPERSGAEQADSPSASRAMQSALKKAGLEKDALSPAVRRVIGLEPPSGYKARLAALEELKNQRLTRLDREGLYVLLRSETGPTSDPLVVNALKNDVLELLLDQQSLPGDLGELMLELVEDPLQDAMWREYLLQHFPAYYQRRWPAAATNQRPLDADPERESFHKTLRRALRQTDNGIAGTALMGWQELTFRYPEFDSKTARQGALRILRDDRAALGSRIGAFQVLGQMGATEVVNPARRVAENRQANLSYRLAAVDALTKAAPAPRSQLPFLNELARRESDPRVRQAVQTAVERLQTQ